MTCRLAYLVAGNPDPHTDDAITRGLHPRSDYGVFLEGNRPRARLLRFRDTARSGHPLVRFYRWRNLPYWGLAALALAERSSDEGLLTAGEDLGVPLALHARIARVETPIYIITHGSFFRSTKFAAVMKILRRMNHVRYLCLSDAVRRLLIESFDVPASCAYNAGWGVDTRFFRPAPALEPGRRIVSAGTANRDYRTLVRAAAPLKVDVKIAADSAWFPLPIDIRNDALPSRIEARSYGDYLRLRDLYASARFVVVPLYPAEHACGYAVIAEAMAMGKAVIATRTAAHDDFIVDGKTGYYVRPRNADDLRERIAQLLANPAEAQRMGERGRARIEELFSLEAYCGRLEAATGFGAAGVGGAYTA